VGGTIAPEDGDRLLAEGVAAVFGPGSPMPAIVDAVSELAELRRKQAEPEEN
jgi:methylmalonyl-CoA mutase cobalamin-binding domain/chain